MAGHELSAPGGHGDDAGARVADGSWQFALLIPTSAVSLQVLAPSDGVLRFDSGRSLTALPASAVVRGACGRDPVSGALVLSIQIEGRGSLGAFGIDATPGLACHQGQEVSLGAGPTAPVPDALG